jgi:hypothetical protein
MKRFLLGTCIGFVVATVVWFGTFYVTLLM